MNELIYNGRSAKRMMEKISIVYVFTSSGNVNNYHDTGDYDTISYDGGVLYKKSGDWYNPVGSYMANGTIIEQTGMEWIIKDDI